MENNRSNKKNALRHILPAVKGYKLFTVLTPIFMLFEVSLEICIPLLMATIVDGGLYRETDYALKWIFSEELFANQRLFVVVVGCLMVLCALLSLTFGILSARTAAIASRGFGKNLRTAILKKIGGFSFYNTDKFTSSSLVMRSTGDINTVQEMFQQLIRSMVRAPIMIILASVMAVNIDLELSFIFVIALPVLVVLLMLLTKIGRPLFKRFLKKLDSMNANVQESLVAVRVVKSFVREDYEIKRFHTNAAELTKSQIRAERVFTFTGPIQLFVLWSCTIALYALGGKEVIFAGTLHKGELVSLISYSMQIVNSLAMMSFLVLQLSRTQASLNRINEVFDEQPDIVDILSDMKVENGSVDFCDVSFSYTKKLDNLQLKNIDFHIESGETIGVIGGTGEGKSTLVQLIPRFYDCIYGCVKVGGRDVRDYSLHELRENVSVVLQNGALFTGTIADNLRWGNENATQGELESACRVACAHDFIESFPEGYNTMLGQGGVNLSGGQKQRIRIARSLLKRPKILIFDDSTSAVDTATDENIRRALRTQMTDSTKIIIAQRIASVMYADRIIVMDKGCISDIGTHDELMERSHIYRDVYASQTKEL